MKLLLALLLLAAWFASWTYGFYCFVQSWRHRIKALPHYSLILTHDQLTPLGRVYSQRHWRAWGIGVVLSVISYRVGAGHW